MHIAFDPPAQAMHLHTFRVVARKERYAGRSAGPKNEVRALAGSKIAPKTTDEGQSFAKSPRRDPRLGANVPRQNIFLGACLRIWLDSSKKYVCFLVVGHSRPSPPAPSEGSGGGRGARASHGRRRPVPRPRLARDALRHTCRPCVSGIQSCQKRRWAVHGKFVQPSSLSFCVSVFLLSAFRFCLRFVCIQCLRLVLSHNTVSGK